MTWLQLAGALATGAAIAAVVGLPLAWALGLRRFWLLAATPALAFTALGATAVLAPFVGLPWNPLTVAVFTLAATLVLFAMRRAVRIRFQSGPADPFPLWTVGAVVGAVVVVGARIVRTIGAPDAISQTFDNAFHLNAIRFVLDTANASSLDIGLMTNPGGALAFYPAGWHGFGALVAQLSGAPIPIVVNAVTLLTTSVFWPIGAVLLSRSLFGSGRAITLTTAVLSTAFPTFPLLMIDYGVLYPYQVGLSLVPVALAATVRALGVGASTPTFTRRWWWWLIVAGAVPGIALVHPGAFVAWLAFSAPMVLVFVVSTLRTARTWPHRSLVVAGFLGYLVAGVLALRVLRPPLDARQWPTTMGMGEAAGHVLLQSTWYKTPTLVPAALVLVGVVCVLLVRSRPAWTALLMYVLAAALFVAVTSFTWGNLRDAMTGSWYNNIPRIAALIPLATIPLAAFGAATLWRKVARTVVARAQPRQGLLLRVGAVILVLSTLVLTQIGAMEDATKRVQRLYTASERSPLLSPDERALLDRLPDEVPEDAVLAGNPYTGAGMAYALSDRRVLMPHILMEITPETEAINEGLAQATPGSAVCRAIEDSGVRFVLDFGDREVHGGSNPLPGLEDLDRSDAVRLVDEQGEARLYEVVACGG